MIQYYKKTIGGNGETCYIPVDNNYTGERFVQGVDQAGKTIFIPSGESNSSLNPTLSSPIYVVSDSRSKSSNSRSDKKRNFCYTVCTIAAFISIFSNFGNVCKITKGIINRMLSSCASCSEQCGGPDSFSDETAIGDNVFSSDDTQSERAPFYSNDIYIRTLNNCENGTKLDYNTFMSKTADKINSNAIADYTSADFDPDKFPTEFSNMIMDLADGLVGDEVVTREKLIEFLKPESGNMNCGTGEGRILLCYLAMAYNEVALNNDDTINFYIGVWEEAFTSSNVPCNGRATANSNEESIKCDVIKDNVSGGITQILITTDNGEFVVPAEYYEQIQDYDVLRCEISGDVVCFYLGSNDLSIEEQAESDNIVVVPIDELTGHLTIPCGTGYSIIM